MLSVYALGLIEGVRKILYLGLSKTLTAKMFQVTWGSQECSNSLPVSFDKGNPLAVLLGKFSL